MLFNFIHIINIWAILLSTIGVTSYQHYCQEELKSVAFFANIINPCCKEKHQKAASCVQHKAVKSCCSNKNRISCHLSEDKAQKPSFKKKKCCIDKQQYAQSDAPSSLEQLDWNSNDLSVAIAPTWVSYHQQYPFLFSTGNNLSNCYNFLCFFPPPKAPLYIAHQAFLC